MLKRRYRLRTRQSVTRVYKKGSTARLNSLSLRYTKNNLEYSRLAVVVSKKVAKSAPTRNRIRRRVYENARYIWPDIQPGVDMIISVFDETAASIQNDELSSQIKQLLAKANILK